MSDSYPFLQIAKQFEVPYGAVLNFADRIDALWRGERTTYWHKQAWSIVNRCLDRKSFKAFALAVSRARERQALIREGKIAMQR